MRWAWVEEKNGGIKRGEGGGTRKKRFKYNTVSLPILPMNCKSNNICFLLDILPQHFFFLRRIN